MLDSSDQYFSYWDSPYNNFNYSYVNTAVDQYKYSTLAIDRLGIGNSSHGEPLNEIQAPIEIAAIAALTKMLRDGTFPGVKQIKKVVHIGHSFGSGQTYNLVNMDPSSSDGIVLTGFSGNGSFVPVFGAGANFVQANDNQPFRLGSKIMGYSSVTNAYGALDYDAALPTPLNYPNGYLANANINSNQYNFFLPKFFDLGALVAGEQTKQPVTPGELLTLGSVPMMNAYAGPVLVITGQNDVPFCGGNCLATGDPMLASIPAAVKKSFPNAGDNFEAYIQPNTGHGLNFHYNQTGTYDVINCFLNGKGLASS
ncbi:uncharacterized protein KY384_007878 [Bacidia gigantensis]|uniref:uncharacterized protein n=1 Tax=Bacidia gigantensis TaxID=2732470 RepID=UPI001D04A417|nr:uncharacterized protein KY384_007878 [Bacidia gigantensis]KAG8527724.1 hypothetical protein KY384_007878 [Bacidia gigantensis]